VLGFAVSAAVLLVGPTAAPAATQLGDAFPPPNSCPGQVIYLQTSSIESEYTVHAPGVINSWSVYAPPTGLDRLKFQVARPAGLDTFKTIGESPLVDAVPGQLNTYPVQVPVLPGDVIGLYWPFESRDTACADNDAVGYVSYFFFGSANPGETYKYAWRAGRKIDVAANLVTTRCAGHPPTIAGTPGRDRLVGTPGRDVIVGLGGRDRIQGRGGRDIICGDGGRDVIKGGGGRDVCAGGKGADSEACEVERSR
jgi:hypothetical protein